MERFEEYGFWIRGFKKTCICFSRASIPCVQAVPAYVPATIAFRMPYSLGSFSQLPTSVCEIQTIGCHIAYYWNQQRHGCPNNHPALC